MSKFRWIKISETDLERVERRLSEMKKEDDYLQPDQNKAKDPKARYYDAGGIEVLDVIKAKLTPEQFNGWLLGNMIKYSCRANFKGDMSRDVEKVAFYSTEMFKLLE